MGFARILIQTTTIRAAKCKELVNEIEGHGLGISGYAPPFRDVPPAEVDFGNVSNSICKSLIFL